MPKSPQSPQPPPKQPAAPKQPEAPKEGTQTQTQQESGPIINAQNAEMSNGEVFIQHGQVERDTFLYSTQAQILIGTLAAFFSLCALIRCYSKCCWDKVNKRTMDHDTYQQGAAVTRHDTNHIEADVQILMDEEDMNNNNNNNEQYPLTDDETKAIMKEFKDTDDEYVD